MVLAGARVGWGVIFFVLIEVMILCWMSFLGGFCLVLVSLWRVLFGSGFLEETYFAGAFRLRGGFLIFWVTFLGGLSV